MKGWTIIGVAILVILLLSDIQSAADDTMIYGCYKKDNGQLRIVGNQTQCKPSELAISWTKAWGPPGPQGPKEDKGDKGDPCPQGPQGPPGTSGGVDVYDANSQYLGRLLELGWALETATLR